MCGLWVERGESISFSRTTLKFWLGVFFAFPFGGENYILGSFGSKMLPRLFSVVVLDPGRGSEALQSAQTWLKPYPNNVAIVVVIEREGTVRSVLDGPSVLFLSQPLMLLRQPFPTEC